MGIKGGKIILHIDTQAGTAADIGNMLRGVAEGIERGGIPLDEKDSMPVWSTLDGGGRLGTIFIEPLELS